MDQLPVIPTPPRHQFREWRIQYLPPTVFLATLLGIFFIWRQNVLPPTFVGQVEPVVANIRSTDNGVITNLFVVPFQPVKAGEVIAAVISTDNRALGAKLDLLRGEISLAQFQVGTMADRNRLAFDYDRLQVEHLLQQLQLKVAEAELPHAEYSTAIAKTMLDQKILSELDYRSYLARLDILQAEIRELTNNVAMIQKQMTAARGDAQRNPEPADNAVYIREALAKLEEQKKSLESLSDQPILLKAPLDGIVTAIIHRAGEAVIAGESIATITASTGERIVGYLRQPLPFTPEPGMTVTVATRSWNRAEIESRVLAVGGHYEIITNLALMRPNVPLGEVGLPLAIVMTDALKKATHPGEIVDLTIREK